MAAAEAVGDAQRHLVLAFTGALKARVHAVVIKLAQPIAGVQVPRVGRHAVVERRTGVGVKAVFAAQRHRLAHARAGCQRGHHRHRRHVVDVHGDHHAARRVQRGVVVVGDAQGHGVFLGEHAARIGVEGMHGALIEVRRLQVPRAVAVEVPLEPHHVALRVQVVALAVAEGDRLTDGRGAGVGGGHRLGALLEEVRGEHHQVPLRGHPRLRRGVVGGPAAVGELPHDRHRRHALDRVVVPVKLGAIALGDQLDGRLSEAQRLDGGEEAVGLPQGVVAVALVGARALVVRQPPRAVGVVGVLAGVLRTVDVGRGVP